MPDPIIAILAIVHDTPAVPEPFHWTESAYGTVLKCRPLEAVAPHVFTTRQLQLSSPSDWAHAASLVEARHAATLNQVHGRNVVVITPGWTPTDVRPSADALVSNNPEVAVAVRAADCVPLLMADRGTGSVAAVHAGWRGTAAGIATSAVEALAAAFGARPSQMVAAIGPSIGACCYTVGSELVDAFAAAGHPRHLIDRWFVTRGDGTGSKDPRMRRLYLDVAAANRDQLVLAGLEEGNIFIANLCTAMHLDLLTSYRAEKEGAVRIAGIIRCRC
jgi:YfiH family protein